MVQMSKSAKSLLILLLKNKILRMKTTLLFSSIIIVLLVGCGPEEKPDQLKAVNNSLESSNKIIAADIETAREEILQMQKQPQTFQIAEILIPRINRIHQYADSIYVMVENLKREVI